MIVKYTKKIILGRVSESNLRSGNVECQIYVLTKWPFVTFDENWYWRIYSNPWICWGQKLGHEDLAWSVLLLGTYIAWTRLIEFPDKSWILSSLGQLSGELLLYLQRRDGHPHAQKL